MDLKHPPVAGDAPYSEKRPERRLTDRSIGVWLVEGRFGMKVFAGCDQIGSEG